MQYEQTLTLNLSAVGQVAYCLRYADRIAGLSNGEDTAWIGWENTAGDNHPPTVPLPTDVAVPCWFSYFLNGVNLGHVVWWVPGKGFYSSPYSTSKTATYQQGTNTRAVLPSIAEVERIYGVKYVGWSEYISGEQVIKGVQMDIFNKGDAINLNVWLYGKDMGRFQEYANGSMSYKNALAAIFTSPEFSTDQLVNAGDVSAINGAVSGDASGQVGETWKTLFYTYVAVNATASYVPVTELFIRKADA